MDTHIITIETKLMHHEQYLDELNNVVYEQQRKIDQLEKNIDHLKKILQSKYDSNDLKIINEPPPHY